MCTFKTVFRRMHQLILILKFRSKVYLMHQNTCIIFKKKYIIFFPFLFFLFHFIFLFHFDFACGLTFCARSHILRHTFSGGSVHMLPKKPIREAPNHACGHHATMHAKFYMVLSWCTIFVFRKHAGANVGALLIFPF